MEGEQKKSKSEKMKDTPVRTDKVGADGTGTVVESCSTDLPGPAASRMVALEALIRGIKVPQCRWPGEMLKAVIDRFGRMPRDGWLLSHSLYCEMFKCETRLDELKKQANFAITSVAGGQCSRRKFAEESTKRVKTIDTYFEESTLHEAKVYLEIKQKYYVLMRDARDREIDNAKWTRKVASEMVDPLILGAVNRAAGEFAAQFPPVSMSDIARQLQVAQLCYRKRR